MNTKTLNLSETLLSLFVLFLRRAFIRLFGVFLGTNKLFSPCAFLKPSTVIQPILFCPFINSCTQFSDVGYARTCVGESLNELSLLPFCLSSLPPPPTPTSTLPLSLHELLRDLYKKPRVDGRALSVWEETLERDDGVCVRTRHGTDLRTQLGGAEDWWCWDGSTAVPHWELQLR